MTQDTQDAFVRFENRDASQVVGLQISCHPSLLPVLMPSLWQNFIDRLATIPDRLTTDNIFMICRQGGEEETYCLCVTVSSSQDLPIGMISFEVPAHTYAVFQHKGSRARIATTYQSIESWQGSHIDYYRRLPAPLAFEISSLSSNTIDQQFSCDIYIPIERVIPALRGLDRIDWSQLHACYNTAEAVPGVLRQIVSEDAEQREAAFQFLDYELIHQDTVYPATAATAPFLCKLLSEPTAPDKEKLFRFITLFAQGYHVDKKPASWRAPSLYDILMSSPEAQAEADRLETTMDESYLNEDYWHEQTHNAVREQIALFFPFLSSKEYSLPALCLLGCFKEERDRIVPHLRTLLENHSDEHVLVYTLSCLGALLTPEDEAVMLLLPYLASNHPEGVRLHAAIALCAIMKEKLSEEMVQRILDARIYPYTGDAYNTYEHWQYTYWLDRQGKYFVALMSVITPINRFIPEPFLPPSILNTSTANLFGFQTVDAEELRYPPGFNRYSVQGIDTMLLRFCFLQGKASARNNYQDLNERQQRLLAMLAEHEIFWPDRKPYKRAKNWTSIFDSMNVPEEFRTSFPGLKGLSQDAYEEELKHSDLVQLLRLFGLPATQDALQIYVNS